MTKPGSHQVPAPLCFVQSPFCEEGPFCQSTAFYIGSDFSKETKKGQIQVNRGVSGQLKLPIHTVRM